jgi:VWFA-related protein
MRARLSILLSALAAVTALAQTSTTLRDLEKPAADAASNSVRLEIYPTLDGRPVNDLQASDVALFEDNAPQTITSFSHVDSAPPGAPRLFVLFLDTYHLPLDVAAAARLPVVKFIDRLVGPEDQVALMTPDMSPSDVPIVRKSVVMSDIMQDVSGWARRGRSVSGNDDKDKLYASCYTGSRRAVADEMIERHHEAFSLDALDSLIAHLRRTGPARKVVITVTDGWRVFTPNPSLLRDESRNRVQGIFGAIGGRRDTGDRGGNDTRDDNRSSTAQMAECETDRATLAMLDDSVRLRSIADDANRGTVTLYPILASAIAQPSGPADDRRRPDRPDSRTPRLEDRAATLRELADNTDGIAAIDEKGLEAVQARIAADLGSYYLVSYTSSNTRLDGRYRAITVRVNRPGVRVRTRRGYRGFTAEALADAADEGDTPVTAALESLPVNARTPLRVRTATWAPSSAAGATLWVVGELDYRARKELTWSAGATGEVVVLASDGREIASRAIQMRPSDGRFSIRLPDGGTDLVPGEYAVRVRLHPEAEPATTVTQTARVAVATDASPLGDPVIWRRGPSTGPQFMMTADPRFERTERIRVELPTLETGTPTAHLVDRAGHRLRVPVAVSTREEPAGGFRWVVAELALAPLGMGNYGIEVTLGGESRVAAFALVP